MNEKNRLTGIFCAFAGGIMWGLSGTFGQYLFLEHRVTAKWLVSVRLLTAGVLMLVPVVIKKKEDIFFFARDMKTFVTMLLYAVLGMGLCQLGYYSAIELSNAGTATVIQYTGPAMIMVYLCLRNKKLPTLLQVAALAMTMVGVVLLATKGELDTLNISTGALAWGLASAVALVIYNLLPIKLLETHSTFLVMGWGMIIAGILLAVYVQPWHIVGSWDIKALGAFAVVVLMGTILAFSIYMEGVKLCGAQTASIVSAIEPVTATIATILIMNINFTVVEFVGMGLIVAAVIILAAKE